MGGKPSKYGYFDLDKFVDWYRRKYILLYSIYCNKNSQCSNNKFFKRIGGPIRRIHKEEILNEKECFMVERTANMHSNFVFEDTENIKCIHLQIGSHRKYTYNNINCENQIKININLPLFFLQYNTTIFKFEFYEPRESYTIKYSYDEIDFPRKINKDDLGCPCINLLSILYYNLYFKVNDEVVFYCTNGGVHKTIGIKEYNDIMLTEERNIHVITGKCLINDIFNNEKIINDLMESIKWHPLTYRQRRESENALNEFNKKFNY